MTKFLILKTRGDNKSETETEREGERVRESERESFTPLPIEVKSFHKQRGGL